MRRMYSKKQLEQIARNVVSYLGFKPLVVEELPVKGEPNILYLVGKLTPEATNVYDEYLWVGEGYEKVGSTGVDLSDYLKKTDINFQKIAYADYQALSIDDKLALLDKGIQIIGSIGTVGGIGNIVNPVIYPRRNFNSYSQGICIGGNETGAPIVGTYEQVHNSTSLSVRAIFTGNDSNMSFVGKILPHADNTGDIGTSTRRVKDIYLAGSLKDGTNEASFTDIKAVIDYAKTQGWIS